MHTSKVARMHDANRQRRERSGLALLRTRGLRLAMLAASLVHGSGGAFFGLARGNTAVFVGLFHVFVLTFALAVLRNSAWHLRLLQYD